MNFLGKRQSGKRRMTWVLAAALLAVLCPAVLTGCIIQTQGRAISYRNQVFTKKLYKNTEKIGFGADGSTVVDDKTEVKKVYRLLAGMKLKTSTKTDKERGDDLACAVIHTKDGKKKTYTFAGDVMRSGRKAYTIVKNNPVAELQKIFASEPAGADKGYRITSVDYPKTAPYPDEADYTAENGAFDSEGYYKAYDAWQEDVINRRSLTGYADTLDRFFTQSAAQFLSGEAGENLVYSPLNVYMALGMLAELTDGNSRRQILDLLGSKDIETLRRQANDLWNANYCNDGAETSILASSLWLNQDVEFSQPSLDILAENYYASAYQGEMGSEELNKALQDWLNEQTGGLLSGHVSEERLKPASVLALATTLYYRAKWHEEFWDDRTMRDTFHGQSQEAVCDFMHKDKCPGTYYQGSRFAAAAQSLEGSGSMWFLLPDDGIPVDELLNDSQAMDFLMSPDRSEWENQSQAILNLSVPKFDVSSKFDLQDGLKALGVTDVFDASASDFSPMTTDLDEIYVAQADHAGRVAIDEKGVTAAAYTVMAADAGSALMPGDEIDFVLDRPFLFAITGYDGLPLFVGVVKQL